jgi:glycerol-3-phosphate dehydrogenase
MRQMQPSDSAKNYDLAVIGAGIHGASIAEAAAQAGYRVLVLEQYDGPARGTSSKSSKLIHGGLRYLESGQFRLVRECLSERRRLLQQQPDLVKLVPFHIPVYKHTKRKTWMIAIGLNLYRLLGGKDFKHIDREKWSQLDGLKTTGLKRVFRYWDAQTDDLKLTSRIINFAEKAGAQVIYGATFKEAECTSESCTIRYDYKGELQTVSTNKVVNASGPWVNTVLERVVPPITPVEIELVQGTHIVVPGRLRRGIYYLEAPSDQRAVFVMPWHGNTMIGTTETPHQGDPSLARPLESEINYLLETRNHYFKNEIARNDVIESFAGLRVLPAGKNNPFSRSRETILHTSRDLPNVLSIYGGKLTSHHHTMMRVMESLNLA